MTPCMRLYAHIGQSLSQESSADLYREWIDSYADPAFDALANSLEDLLDRYNGRQRPYSHDLQTGHAAGTRLLRRRQSLTEPKSFASS